MWLIKRAFPSGYSIVNPETREQPNIIFWGKQDARDAVKFVAQNNTNNLPHFLLSRGIPYQSYR